MFGNLFQTICRIGIFMICAQAIVHFRPEEAYEKYLKLLVGSMILIQLFFPVGRLLFRGEGQELVLKSEEFMEELEAQMAAAEKDALEAEAVLEQMTLEEIRKRVEEAHISEESSEDSREMPDDKTETAIEIEPVEEIRVRIQENSYNQ